MASADAVNKSECNVPATNSRVGRKCAIEAIAHLTRTRRQFNLHQFSHRTRSRERITQFNWFELEKRCVVANCFFAERRLIPLHANIVAVTWNGARARIHHRSQSQYLSVVCQTNCDSELTREKNCKIAKRKKVTTFIVCGAVELLILCCHSFCSSCDSAHRYTATHPTNRRCPMQVK